MVRYFKQILCVLTVCAFIYVPDVCAQQASDFVNDSELILRANYYGRYRSTSDDRNEIKVNVFGFGVDYRSGYAFGVLGLDASAYANIGSGDGMSELLDYDRYDDEDSSLASVNILLGKFRVHDTEYKVDFRAGITPIDVGTIGTSAGLHSHSYRGAELKVEYLGVQLGYGIADRFNPEWKRGPRDMETANDGDIEFIHTAGLRYEFEKDSDRGFVDAGVGQGWDYRKNAQGMFCYPLREGASLMELKGYGFWGKYDSDVTGMRGRNEYHLGISSGLSYEQTLMLTLGYSYTWAPDSAEMNFRLTPWGESDNRNYIRTAAQLDDFVWHNQSVFKVGLDINMNRYLVFDGLTIGAAYLRGWNLANAGGQTTSWEVDYYAYYEIPEGMLKGLNFGVYAAHLRFGDDFVSVNNWGKQNRNDIKGIVGYTYKVF